MRSKRAKCPTCNGSGYVGELPLRVNLDTNTIETEGGRAYRLSPNEAALAYSLLKVAPTFVSHKALIRDIWGTTYPEAWFVSLSHYRSQLNRLFRSQGIRAHVQNVYRVGSRIVFEH